MSQIEKMHTCLEPETLKLLFLSLKNTSKDIVFIDQIRQRKVAKKKQSKNKMNFKKSMNLALLKQNKQQQITTHK